ncbi:aspartate dehydrogenase [Sporosarcina sp. NCCP-2716]|uniref:aspartate dehydrogenase n=1 Tax=Sporosarcina sp. NCCP-2716 TaxID=2943679 RepID=UPI00203B03C8|nr:aspartate dehydrogenase [Sporosarcina sp. NCCP-2716]GKV69698.1 aspartate dehydrogenase [Sporosarcina sp. NCCP-2716]
MNIGVIGTGAIAEYLVRQVNGDERDNMRIIAIFGRNPETGRRLSSRFGVEFDTDIAEFLARPLDLVVEAASVEAARRYSLQVADSGKDLVIGSIGALQDPKLLGELQERAAANGTSVHLPSGAIGGLDLLQSANAAGGLDSVRITTRKSPASLGLEQITQETVLFDGSAREAIVKFPKNVNVAIVLALAGIGMEATRVRVITDPKASRNSHTIEAEGTFGSMRLTVDNEPMAANPKTSLLAAMSILSVLRQQKKSLKIGS